MSIKIGMHNKKAYFWNFGGSIIPQALFLVTNIILAHFLTPDDFGAIGVLTIFVSLASTLSDTGFSGSLVKEDSITPIDCSTVFCFNLTISSSLYLLLFLFSNLIERFFSYPGLQNIIRCLSLVFIIRSIGIVPRAILTRKVQFDKQAVISVVSVSIACAIAIVGGVVGWKSYALVAYQLTYAFCETILLIVITKYEISFKFSKDSFKRLFSFGFFTTICTTVDTAYENIMALLFGKFLSIGAAGYFSQAQKLEVASTNTLVKTLNSVSFPILTRKKNDLRAFELETNSIQKMFISAIFPILFLIVFFSHEIIVLLYGKEWIESSLYLRFLIFVGMCYILECLDRNNIKSLGYVKELSKLTIFKRILGLGIILSCLVISPFYMLYGYILSTFIGFLLNKRLYCRIIGKKFYGDLFRECKLLIAPLCFGVLGFCIKMIVIELYMEIIIISIMLGTYYYIFFRSNNIL